jgi:hypothetical protein
MENVKKLMLQALEKEYARLLKIHEKAKDELNECLNVGQEEISIHQEFIKVCDLMKAGKDVKNTLNDLTKRNEKANHVLNKDINKLMEKEYSSKKDCGKLKEEIDRIKFFIAISKY